MRRAPARARGFSLVELMVAMLLLSFILAKAVPSLMGYIRDDRIHSVAEEMRDGLHTARMEAIRRNTTVLFVPNGTGWAVVLPGVSGAPDETLQSRTPRSSELSLAAAASAGTASFNGSGRLVGGAFSVEVGAGRGQCAADGGPARCMRLAVAPGGMIRMCDPALPAGDPQAC